MAEETSVFDLTNPLDVVAVEFLSAQSKTAQQSLARVAQRLTGNTGRPSREQYAALFDALQRRGEKIRDAQRDAILEQLGHKSEEDAVRARGMVP